MTTGGGGMVTTDSSELAARLKYLSTQAKDDPLRFIHDNVGYNYRLTNLQAALGVAQLECMPEFLSAKRRIYERYRAALAGSDLFSLAEVPSVDASNFWLNNLRLRGANAGRALDLVRHLTAHGIEARPIWWPNHLQRPFREFEAFEISRATLEVERVVSIPSSTGLTESDQGRVIAAILAFC
jgi:perosamine synthetase